MNEFLTAYLYGYYAVRRGAVSAADSMGHVLDMIGMARGAKTAVDGLIASGARALGWRGSGRGDRQGRRIDA